MNSAVPKVFIEPPRSADRRQDHSTQDATQVRSWPPPAHMTLGLHDPALISIVVPFHNEEEIIRTFGETLIRQMDGHTADVFEVVCIDDGSSDDTLELLRELVECDPRFRIVELSRNFGKEAALTAGIEIAVGDAVITIDADLQDPPELIPKMIDSWRKGADVVLAKRVDRTSDGVMKRWTARHFYRLHNYLADITIPENVGDFRLMDRTVIAALKRLPERQRFMKGLFTWVGFHCATIEYERPLRVGGQTKFSGAGLWNLALEGITSFSTMPLKIWTYVGFAGAMLSALYITYLVGRTLIYGVDVPGYASLLVVILFLGSLQLISVGVLGEYIGRIYMESKQRPRYIVRNIYGKD